MLFNACNSPTIELVTFNHPAAGPTSCRLDPTDIKKLMKVASKLAIVVAAVSIQCPLMVIEGFRREKRQNELFRSGHSKLPFPQSKHNIQPAEAVDIAPLPLDWQDRDRFMCLAGAMWQASQRLGVALRWGGDWNRAGDGNTGFDDLGHYELWPFPLRK